MQPTLADICAQSRLTPEQTTLDVDQLPMTGEGYSSSDYDDFLQSLQRHLLHNKHVDVVACSLDPQNTLITETPYFDIRLMNGDTVEVGSCYVRFCIYHVDSERVQKDVAAHMAAARDQITRRPSEHVPERI